MYIPQASQTCSRTVRASMRTTIFVDDRAMQWSCFLELCARHGSMGFGSKVFETKWRRCLSLHHWSSEKCSMNFSWSPFCEVVSICTPKGHWRSQSPDMDLLISTPTLSADVLVILQFLHQLRSNQRLASHCLCYLKTWQIVLTMWKQKKELNSLSLHVLDSRTAFFGSNFI